MDPLRKKSMKKGILNIKFTNRSIVCDSNGKDKKNSRRVNTTGEKISWKSIPAY